MESLGQVSDCGGAKQKTSRCWYAVSKRREGELWHVGCCFVEGDEKCSGVATRLTQLGDAVLRVR